MTGVRQTRPTLWGWGIVVLASIVPAVMATADQGQARDRSEVRRIIADAAEPDRPFLTQGEEALIRSRCGYREDEWEDESIRFEGDVLVCENGRRVDDPEVRAAMAGVRQRVREHIRSAMARPEVRRAISGEIDAEVRAALGSAETRSTIAAERAKAAAASAKIAAELSAEHGAFASVRFEEVREALARARAEIDRIDFDAIRADIDDGLERAGRD